MVEKYMISYCFGFLDRSAPFFDNSVRDLFILFCKEGVINSNITYFFSIPIFYYKSISINILKMEVMVYKKG